MARKGTQRHGFAGLEGRGLEGMVWSVVVGSAGEESSGQESRGRHGWQARNDTERKAGSGQDWKGRQGWVRFGALWKDEVGQARSVRASYGAKR